MMVLLSTLALGLLSLSSITLRSSEAGAAMATAKANARLALAMAIGDLQKFTGPDQRITADGSRDSDQTRKHWIGAWKTTRTQGGTEVPVVNWDAGSSAILDARSTSGVAAKDLFQGWLVSGWPNIGNEKVALVSTGSVANATDSVNVPLVAISDGNRRLGSMAYWVSDEAEKAAFGVPDYLVGKQPATPGDDGYKRMLMPQNAGIEVLAGLEAYDKATAANLEKAFNPNQAALAGAWGTTPLKNYFHAVSATSHTLLADPVRSGLKRDLSVYLENGSAPARDTLLPQVDDTTALLEGSKRQAQGPKLGTFRAWTKLADDVTTDGTIAPRGSANTVSMGYTQGGLLAYGKLPSMQASNMPIGPVVASVQMYTRFSYVRGYLVTNLYPRIVLWNPYNVTLKSSAYSMDLNFAFSDDGKVMKGSTTYPETYDYTPRGNKDMRPRLSIEATEFAPGEALVFSPKISTPNVGGNSMQLVGRTATGENLMSAKTDPALMSNFYVTLRTTPVTVADLPATFDHNQGGYYWVDGMDWWENNTGNGMKVSLHLGSATNYTNMMANPVLQVVDMDNWKREYSGRFNPGRWRVGGQEPLYDYETTQTMIPWSRTCYGFRYKWPVEVNPYDLAGTSGNRYWEAAVQSDYNLRAPFCYRSPYDNITDNGESHHWYMWGPYASDSVQSLDYNSSQLAVWKNSSGYYRGSPFFGAAKASASHVYPKYDLPYHDERVVSLGSFQHVPLTPFVWHPAYAVGSGWVPANLKDRARTADSTTAGQWTSEIKFLPTWYRQTLGSDETVYDLAYEANHELWDRYYLSGSKAAERAGFISQPTVNRMPNSRLVPRTDVKPSATRMNDYYQAASEVMLAGGFNVNSMNADAWKAVLASLRDVTVPAQSGGSGGASGTSFNRFLTPPGGDVSPVDSYKAASWNGFRKLSDAELGNLATKIVDVVRERGPFLSVSDFVNRRLVPTGTSSSSDQGLMGALDDAIARAGLNQSLISGDTSFRMSGFGAASYEPGNNAAAWGETSHVTKTGGSSTGFSKAAGMPTFLQQGDILQSLGSTLTARGDTFRVRAYGEARDGSNKVIARAWCDAVVQRLPDYVDASNASEIPAFASTGTPNPAVSTVNRQFGRRYQIASFRWMLPSEI
ncbi:hypothetical protein [Luteolibacter sp. LG18]|uniref:hypothetical protein n=1 Tax=Luteolibacter sp. LG18 TaxID=2819286 RepID=UPI002B309815|nr:hypothetical protein llg_17390 [Luteolibacter sp. LG18]